MVAPVILGILGSGFLITPVPPYTLQVTIGDIVHLLLIVCLSPEIPLGFLHGIFLCFSQTFCTRDKFNAIFIDLWHVPI